LAEFGNRVSDKKHNVFAHLHHTPTTTVKTMNWIVAKTSRLGRKRNGSIFVEYLLLLTLVGIGVICGLAAVRSALIQELMELADAIRSISCP
jgi:pilus assembly protein Flp/PilA